MLRVHIYEPVIVKTKKYGLIGEVETRTVDPIEIFGSKLVALMTRSTPRDLYDFFYMINANIFGLTCNLLTLALLCKSFRYAGENIQCC